MKKDIEWLKEEVVEILRPSNLGMKTWHNISDDILNKIDQLDEPETLSQEWIDEHKVARINNLRKMTTNDVVPVDDLQNLLAPKQELPVIPKFVAEYLDFAKSDVPLMRVMELANTRNEWPKWEKEYDWISANDEKFARAWLDGFTIANEEEEQKYYVEDGKHALLCKWESLEGWKVISTIESTEDDIPIEVLDYGLTEQEIKDYDERFWPFAVKVEEPEE